MISFGLLIIGHGTREPQGTDGFLTLVAQVAAMLPDVPVEPCFLELAEPTIPAGIERLVERQVRHIVAMPLLLFAAGHVRRDIPKALEAAAAQHVGVSIDQASHLGCHARILELSTQRYHEAISERPGVAPEETVLVLVGRGSRDPRATLEMRQFAQLRARQTPVRQLETGFLAMERPPLTELLPQVGAAGASRIVVQPHLLLPGCLLEQVRAEVERASRQWDRSEWVVTEPLGPDRLVAQAVVEMVAASNGGPEPGESGRRRSTIVIR
jgi:sirohydrochlorin ferrochelatase